MERLDSGFSDDDVLRLEQSLLPIDLEKGGLLIQPGPKSLLQTLTRELHYLSTFGVHTLVSLVKGVSRHSEIAAKRRDWRVENTLYSAIGRGLLRFRHHSVARAHVWATNPVTTMLLSHIFPWSVGIQPFSFRVNLCKLLARETQLQAGPTPFSGNYCIPPEGIPDGDKTIPSAHTLTGEWVVWESESSPPSSRVLLFLHGGAYFACTPQTHRQLTYRYARETGARVFSLAYRLAPKHPFPAALHDAYAAFLYLTNPNHEAFKAEGFFNTNFPIHNPVNPKDISLMGDSAGAALCVSLIAYLKWLGVGKGICGEGIPTALPGAAILISPWVDLSLSTESWSQNSESDIIFPFHIHEDIHHKGSKNPVWWYTAGIAGDPRPGYLLDNKPSEEKVWAETVARHPLVSPLFLSNELLTFDVPVLIQAGDAECLRDETLLLAEKLARCNTGMHQRGLIKHELYENMPHVFPAMSWLEHSMVSIRNVGAFLDHVYTGVKQEENLDSSKSLFRVNHWESKKICNK